MADRGLLQSLPWSFVPHQAWQLERLQLLDELEHPERSQPEVGRLLPLASDAVSPSSSSSLHICWAGDSPPAHRLAHDRYVWPPEEVSCEFRNVCYDVETERFEYYLGHEEFQAGQPPPEVSVWSGASEGMGGGYEPPDRRLPITPIEGYREAGPQVDLPTYAILRGASSNFGHMLFEMLVPLIILITQAETIPRVHGERLLFFLDDCDPESIYNTVPAMPKKRKKTSRKNCDRISDALTKIISDHPWLDKESARSSGSRHICFSSLIAGTGRWGFQSRPSIFQNHGLLGTALRQVRDWAAERLVPLGLQTLSRGIRHAAERDEELSSVSDRNVLAFLLKQPDDRRNLANLDEVIGWLQEWAAANSLEYQGLVLAEMTLAEQVAAFQRIRIVVTSGGSLYSGSCLFFPDWTTVILIPQCGGCRPSADAAEDCDGDTLYTRGCTPEEWGMDQCWNKPKQRTLYYPAEVTDTVERLGQLDVIVGQGRLLRLLDEGSEMFRGVHSHVEERLVKEQAHRPVPVHARFFDYTWPEILQTPLHQRCVNGAPANIARNVRTCLTNFESDLNYCELVHNRCHMAKDTLDKVPLLSSCYCDFRALEVDGSSAWNWELLKRPAYLRLFGEKYDIATFNGTIILSHSQAKFGQSYTAFGWFGHPSIIEMLKRRSFFEDKVRARSTNDEEDVECDSEECMPKQVLLTFEWLSAITNAVSFGEDGATSPKRTSQSSKNFTMVVAKALPFLMKNSDDKSWEPSIRLILNFIQEAIATDFASALSLSPYSGSCGLKTKISEADMEKAYGKEAIQAALRAEPLMTFHGKWLDEVCSLKLEASKHIEPPGPFPAHFQEVALSEPPKTSVVPFCRDMGDPFTIKSGGLTFHVLARSIVQSPHKIFDVSAEVEVVMFVHHGDACLPTIFEKDPILLSEPSAALFPWICEFHWHGQLWRVEGLPVSVMGFVLNIICPMPEEIFSAQAPFLLQLQTPFRHPHKVPVAMCPPNREEAAEKRVVLAACLRIGWEIDDIPRLAGIRGVVEDWFNFHMSAGVELFVIYDQDGSFAKALPQVVKSGFIEYHSHFRQHIAHPGEETGSVSMSAHRRAAQGNAHCLASLKGRADWVAMLPGLDTFLWMPPWAAKMSDGGKNYKHRVPPFAWAKLFLEQMEDHRHRIASLQLAEVQFAQGNGSRGKSLFTTYQYRSPPRVEMSHTILVNPENVVEVGMGHFAFPRFGAITVNVSHDVFRINHYVDFVQPEGSSRCDDCTLFDDSVGLEMEEWLRMSTQ